MTAGPVIQVFRADRLPDDVSRALVGVIVFEEDGLSLTGVRALVQELGLR
jgi:fumarylacetoacetate (FAA) hydrolase family protein